MIITLNIFAMHCASGVSTAQVNFAQDMAYVEFEPEKLKVQDLISIIAKEHTGQWRLGNGNKRRIFHE